MQKQTSTYEELIIRYISGEITDAEAKQLAEILHSETWQGDTFDALVRMRAQLYIPALQASKADNYRRIKQKLQLPGARNTFKFKHFARIAALFVLMLGVGGTLYYAGWNSNGFLPRKYTVVVPAGKQDTILLPDGSKVHLNAESTFSYDASYGNKTRHVHLTGEAYFEVAKDKNCPFIVHAGKLNIRVLGTSFNVRSYTGEPTIEVNLVSGSVELSKSADDSKTPTVRLKPDQRAVFDTKLMTISTSDVIAKRASAWTQGKLCFDNAPIGKILNDLERHFDVEIKVLNADIETEEFTGSIDLHSDIKEILNYIDVDKKMIISHKGKNIYIDSK